MKSEDQAEMISSWELRVAWVLLIGVGIVSFPPPKPGPYVLFAVGLVFLPGTLVLATRRGCDEAKRGFERLLGRSTGRLHLIIGLALVVCLGVVFQLFAGIATAAGFLGWSWVIQLVRHGASWDRWLPGWNLFGLTLLVVWAGVEFVLKQDPVARRLGTPAEWRKWENRIYYDSLDAINFFGFRSTIEEVRKRPGTYRIIALGDSFTGGSLIPSSDSTWPALLEGLLRGRTRDREIEVVNMGHGAWATGNEAELLRRIGWQFDPDLVIVQWLNNDFLPTLPNFELGPGAPERTLLVPWRFRTGLVRNSSILRLLEGVVTAWREPMREMVARQSAPGSPGWLAVEQGLKEMAQGARQRCVPILLVLYPYFYPERWTAETHPEKGLHQRVARLGTELGYEVLDLLPVFGEKGGEGRAWWGTAYDSHPGGHAQAVAAAAIARRIEESGFIDRRHQPETWCGN